MIAGSLNTSHIAIERSNVQGGQGGGKKNGL